MDSTCIPVCYNKRIRRHKVFNFAKNALAAIAAYSFFYKKPSINIGFCIEDKGGMLTLF